MFSDARAVLERHFGYTDFRPGQSEAIAAALSGRDALVVMPTGGGKSLCFQVPALVRPGLTLVVSPLIALMKDQVAALERRGIKAALVNSTLSGAEIKERLRSAATGELKLLYVAPERFDSPAFQRSLRDMHIDMVAIDEAHCVSEWGHDFRPSYLRLRRVWSTIGGPPLLALTATATPEVRKGIVKELGLRRPQVIVRGFDRPNLSWAVRREERNVDKSRALLSLLAKAGEGSYVVYASTRKLVESAAELLRANGIAATAYHAGLDRDRRARAQDQWMSGAVSVVVATNAFGMGIDKEDVRRVIHLQMPGSLEAYYQEAGRAGRDGLPAECVLLHSYRDRFTHEFFIRCSYPPRKIIKATYRALCAAVSRTSEPARLKTIARRVHGIKSEREVESALRILGDDGVIEDCAAGATYAVRWIASPESVDLLLANGCSSEISVEALHVLRGLYEHSATGTNRFLRFRRRELARFAGGDLTATRAALDELQRGGLIGWRDDARNTGFVPREPTMDPADVAVDWDRVARRRKFELLKLRRMEEYAFQQGCRRRYLLRYFGESFHRSRCDGCDRCW